MVDAEQVGRAVIRQALSDAGVGVEGGVRLSVSDAERGRARDFLTAAAGSWREAREFWCALADLQSDKLRSGTLRALRMDDPLATAIDQPLKLFHPVPKPSKPRRAIEQDH